MKYSTNPTTKPSTISNELSGKMEVNFFDKWKPKAEKVKRC